MKDSREGQAFRKNVVYERNPCDCNCVLFDDEPPGNNPRKMAGRLDESEGTRQFPESFVTDKAPLGSEITKNKISVSSLTKRRTERQSTRKITEEQCKTNKQTKVLIDLLEPPLIQTDLSHPTPTLRPKQTQPIQLHRPYVMLTQPVTHIEDANRKLSFQPSGVSASGASGARTATSQAQVTSSQKSSKQQLLSTSTGFMLRPPNTNSFTHDGHTVAFSQLSFSDNRYLSECSSIPRYRAIPQIVTTQVPQTVPEELTSRSNTVDIIVPPLPLRQTEQKPKKHNQQSQTSQRHPPRYTQPQGATSARGHVSARHSVGGSKNMILREVQSVHNNLSPQAQDQQKPPMRFRHIQSIGQDIDVQRDDASSQVLGHYTPAQQLPIKKLLNRMSQPPEFNPPEEFSMNPHHSYSSRSKHQKQFHSDLNARLERLKRVSPSREES